MLFADLALLRRYRQMSSRRIPFSMRFGFRRNRLRHEAHRDWPGGYIDTEHFGHLYVPKEVDLMASRRLLKPTDEMGWLRQWLPPGSIMIDIGANIGDWSLPAAYAVGSLGRIIAVEPIPRMAEALRKTFGINHLVQAKVVETALSAQAGKASFSIERENSGGSRLGGHAASHDVIEVAVTTLDALVAQERLPRVDFIKIDVEGHEPDVLEGARETLRQWRPVLYVETGQEGDEGRRRIADLLTSIGYRIGGYHVPGGIIELEWDEYRTASGRCEQAGIHNIVFY